MSLLHVLVPQPLPEGRVRHEELRIARDDLRAIAPSLARREDVTLRFDGDGAYTDLVTGVTHVPDPDAVDPSDRGYAMSLTLGLTMHECMHQRLDRDLALRGAARGEAPPNGHPCAAALFAQWERWGTKVTALFKAAVEARADRTAQRLPGATTILRDLYDATLAAAGGVAVFEARHHPVDQLCNVIVQVGRRGVAADALPAPIGPVTVALALDARLELGDDLTLVALIAHTFSTMEALAGSAADPDVRHFAEEFLRAPYALAEPTEMLLGLRVAPPSVARPHGAASGAVPGGPRWGAYRVASAAHDVERRISTRGRSDLRAAWRALSRHPDRQVRELVEALLGKATAPGRPRLVGGRSEGVSVDPASLPAIVFGTGEALWEDRVRTPGRDLCVLILVDQSGSMRSPFGARSRIAFARAFCAALCRALEGVPVAVGGFTTRPDEELAEDAFGDTDEGAWQGCARVAHAVLHTLAKDFDDEDASGVAALDADEGLNFDGEALRWGASLLAAREESHKVLVVLSDSHPSHPPEGCEAATERWFLRETVRALEADGVDVVGLGVGSDAVASYFRRHMVLHA